MQILTVIANHSIGSTLMLFAPIPYREDETDPAYVEAQKANRLWRSAQTKVIEEWKRDRAEFQGETEETYLKAREDLLERLSSK
jgi:hypothetical protein